MFYYIEGWRDPHNPENPLRKMHNALSPEGVGVIMAQSKLSDNYAFRSCFLPMIHGPDVNELQTEDISTAMTQMDIPHDSEIVECRTGANDFFNAKGEFEPNTQGAHLLSFLLRYDWNVLEPGLKEQVRDYCIDTIHHDEEGQRFMTFRDLFVWFRK